ncbi:Methyltransferase type 11 [Desulfofarcimen acetoxidans DSM 771]|uniref:Arsenite methyltransferase n=1 Tax=Desulfofarcimen acetoxidans (strain ATCC 49208 / DSM 771 / KCTC 5769 / VKM B-1644 / 5575) TaxID=485916 RepID=C8W0U7_DESAS|nr:arsenite methyltransferase [Desulfofarcimen acetoxidans]ACV63352.1 Methyltransferase type 11 [Desulfofarcimen acetoxidans DSM 771]
MNKNDIKDMVRNKYSQVVKSPSGCCSGSNCCIPGNNINDVLNISKKLGYSDEQLKLGLGEANLGLGCGNPLAIEELKNGEVVLDLGSGAGFDVFLAARKVGPSGNVIGVDMTPEMISKARHNAASMGFSNVEFRLGEIEHLPVADSSVDVIISNCVINLSPDKQAVFNEAFRVLKPGGKIVISDVVRVDELPEEIRNNNEAYCGCISGAILQNELVSILNKAGFKNILVKNKANSEEIINSWNFGQNIEKVVVSADIRAIKPI